MFTLSIQVPPNQPAIIDVVSYTIDINGTSTQTVGKLNLTAVKRLTGLDFPTAEVRLYPGALKHIRKEHSATLNQYGLLIPDMIANPDYIGKHPKEPNSIELIKQVAEDLLLAIKFDPSGYLFVSSFYELNNGTRKIQNRLASGRLVPYSSS